MSKEKLNYAGEFNLMAAEWLSESGVATDIRNLIDQITLYEDLFSPFMSGNLILIDTLDLPSEMIPAGGDILHLTIATPGIDKKNVIDKYFHIYKLGDRVETNERTQVYVLYFNSVDSLAESSINISKTFKAKAEQNVETILRQYIKSGTPLLSDNTIANVRYTSNYWAPTRNIVYNCDMAVDSETKTPSMLFYESRAGYELRSLVGLSLKDPYKRFEANSKISTISASDVDRGDVQKNFEQDYGTILTVEAKVYFDYIDAKTNGSMNSRLFSYDFTTKKIVDKTYDANSDTRKRANARRLFSDQLVTNSYKGSHGTVHLYVDRNTGLYDGVVDTTDFYTKQKRIGIMRQFQQHKIEITVLGRTDYTVGQCIDIDVNRNRAFTKDMADKRVRDPMISGRYVASAVCHRFNADGKHECTIELIRDSVGKE